MIVVFRLHLFFYRYGRDVSRLYLYGGKGLVVYKVHSRSNCTGQILDQSLAIRGQKFKNVSTFKYGPDGALISANQTGGLNWTYAHDANGNVVRINFGLGVTENSVNNTGERIERIGAFHSIVYDSDGRLVARHDLTFSYDGFGKLGKVILSCTQEVHFHNLIDVVNTYSFKR